MWVGGSPEAHQRLVDTKRRKLNHHGFRLGKRLAGHVVVESLLVHQTDSFGGLY